MVASAVLTMVPSRADSANPEMTPPNTMYNWRLVMATPIGVEVSVSVIGCTVQ